MPDRSRREASGPLRAGGDAPYLVGELEQILLSAPRGDVPFLMAVASSRTRSAPRRRRWTA